MRRSPLLGGIVLLATTLTACAQPTDGDAALPQDTVPVNRTMVPSQLTLGPTWDLWEYYDATERPEALFASAGTGTDTTGGVTLPASCTPELQDGFDQAETSSAPWAGTIGEGGNDNTTVTLYGEATDLSGIDAALPACSEVTSTGQDTTSSITVTPLTPPPVDGVTDATGYAVIDSTTSANGANLTATRSVYLGHVDGRTLRASYRSLNGPNLPDLGKLWATSAEIATGA